MSLNHFTQYRFSNEYGITGTLAADPVFGETKEGKEYAKLVLYCKAVDNADGDDKASRRRDQPADTHELPLLACVRVFDEVLLSAVKQLKKGYFVNFNYDKVTFALGEDAETEELRVRALLVANELKVRHIPKKSKAANSNHRVATSSDDTRHKKAAYRRYQ